MIIGITGYSGFLGKHLLDTLSKIGKFEIICIGRNPPNIKSQSIKFIFYDYSKKNLINLKVDILIHLAGITSSSRNDNLQKLKFNYQGIKNLIQNIKYSHLIYISTIKIYDLLAETNPAQLAYINSKIKAEKFICEQQNHRYTIVRLGNCYGRHDERNRLIPNIIKYGINRRKFKLELNLKTQLSLLSADDFSILLEALFSDLQNYTNQIINFFQPNLLSVEEIIEVFHDHAGYEYLLPDNSNRITLFSRDKIQSNYLIDGFEFQKFKTDIKRIWHINRIEIAKRF